MNTQKFVTGVVVIVALLFAVLYITKPVPQTQIPAQQVGSVSGPDRFFPHETSNGVGFDYYRTGFTQATTTVCAYKNTATSTIRSVTANFVVSSTSASTVTFATSTSAFATTTSLQTQNLSANESDGFAYAGKNGDVILPNIWIVVSMAGGNGSFSPTGACQVYLQSL